MIHGNLRLRPVAPDDAEFLYQLYRSTRWEELASVAWPDAEKDAFLRQQFALQSDHYGKHYAATTEFQVIEIDGERAGRLYVARWPREIRIVDIALLPAYRGRGTGAHLLRGLLAEGASSSRTVSIHVERANPALRLYERLGFVFVEERGVYFFMERRPSGEGQAPRSSGAAP